MVENNTVTCGYCGTVHPMDQKCDGYLKYWEGAIKCDRCRGTGCTKDPENHPIWCPDCRGTGKQ